MATLFVELLRPLAPSKAAEMTDAPPVRRALPQQAKPSLKRALETGAARPPIAIVPAAELEQPVSSARLPSIPAGPLIAIVLTELGPNPGAAKIAIDRLPQAVSLAFSPYADASRGLAATAKAGGHEVWLSVPMQPKSYPRISPGKNALLTGESSAENVRRLEWALSRVDGPVGITNMMGSAFTEDAAAMRPVLGALKARNLSYIDARSSGKSIGEAEARAVGVAAATNDRFLDEPVTAANIRRNLDELVATAKRRGYAIGYARATPETLRQLESWSAGLGASGVTLVGAGTVARKNSGG